MKILYGVQGTGNGHIARARIMATAMAKRNDIEVDFVFSGRAPDAYFDMECFGDYRTFNGLTFQTHKGQVSQWQTVKQAKPLQLLRDIHQLDVSGYDLLLNDFEPVTAWAARRRGLPSISVSHQAAFTYDVPRHDEQLSDKLIMRCFAPTDVQLGVHWFHFDQPIVPPFINDKPASEPTNSHVLVYLPFEDIDEVREMLEPLTEQKFVCFHPRVTTEHKQGHISWFRPSKPGFRSALQHCSGVISNGGFELASESLQLKKKLLVKPLRGQFEQISNLKTLMTLGLCLPLYQLDTDTVEDWLSEPASEGLEFPDDPTPMLDWIIAGNWSDTQPLCDALWKQVKFGPKTRERLMSLAF
ncbi:MJ1255/VC2487 family glycosyltransferase [Alteromonas gilva]|uniref:Glycosyltransferase family protein n=1 Tax=Alteromonas gilva TaxID=2987522 RepID=A0ABT5KXX3_9ALTE|nr:MJ1255/VC2487 family glycosyltransferase [Alteromonas gilva]MDC8829617.1 glycosyltransferase family protein [Alteromonas gilva]